MKRVLFVEMMGEPGSYDASVYDHFPKRDREGEWFTGRFGDACGLSLASCNVCIGERLPHPHEIDGVVLAGSYNSVHDNTPWQQTMRAWLPAITAQQIPTLAVCGSHQLLAHIHGADVETLSDGPYAGTYPLELTPAGRDSAIMQGIDDESGFQFANTEHVLGAPAGATLLGASGRVPIAALDYGHHCYSTQFHPEGTHETLSTVWRHKAPGLMENYWPEDNGFRLVNNFLGIVEGGSR